MHDADECVIQLPHDWQTRDEQAPLWRYMASTPRDQRAVALWHRRFGKDDVALHWTATASQLRVGNYWHMLPEASQARKAIWDAVDANRGGKKRIDLAFPEEMRKTTRKNDMMIEFLNGSTWQVVGSDNFNSLVGSAPIGIVFSEYSLSNPLSWEYLRPILRENGGWALFLYTSRGKNHGYTLYNMAKKLMKLDGSWYCQKLTVDDTGRQHLADAERKEGMSEDMVQQEYYCSFDAANPGAYYGKQIAAAWKEGRVCRVPVEPGIQCECWFDLGMDDSTSIWITQTVGREIRCVKYYESSGEGLAYYANYLHEWAKDKQVTFKNFGMPHDIEVRELGTGKSRKEVCEEKLGMTPVEVCPALDVMDGIEQVRRIFPQCWFDEEECAHGLACLTDYTKAKDEKASTPTITVYKTVPQHNWASHGADAFRTMAMLHPGRSKLKKDAKRDRYGEKRGKTSWMSG